MNSTMKKSVVVWLALLLPALSLIAQEKRSTIVGTFNYEGEPLLELAMRNDYYFTTRLGVDPDEDDPYVALDAYEAYLQERNPADPNAQAEIYSRMGMICIFGMENRELERAVEYFQNVVELAEPDYISRHIYMARTNYASLVKDYEESFEANLDLMYWLLQFDETAIRNAATRKQNGSEAVGIRISLDSGERSEISRDEADHWMQEQHDRGLNETVQKLYESVRTYRETRMPEICVSAAIFTSDPVASMNRLLEVTEGTVIADHVRASMPRAEAAKRMREEGEAFRAQQEAEATEE